MREHYLNHKIIPFDAHTRSLSLSHTHSAERQHRAEPLGRSELGLYFLHPLPIKVVCVLVVFAFAFRKSARYYECSIHGVSVLGIIVMVIAFVSIR